MRADTAENSSVGKPSPSPPWRCRQRRSRSGRCSRNEAALRREGRRALFSRLDDSKIEESQEVQPGIVLDFNAQKQVVAIEVLRLRERFPSADVKRLQFEVA
ncbi:MAG TPA: DUF2283 domain-containing protein [Burkholderiales bacterium]|nr:DUF2283 domain-containing protein [Burkholderiales bacterium]